MPDQADETIVIRISDTPSGRLLARALEIMAERSCTMGEAMDAARAEDQPDCDWCGEDGHQSAECPDPVAVDGRAGRLTV